MVKISKNTLVCSLIVSNECPVCIKFKGNGRLNNGSSYMDPVLIKQILIAPLSAYYTIINFKTLNFPGQARGDVMYQRVDSVSYFELVSLPSKVKGEANKDVVRQYLYYQAGEHTFREKIDEGGRLIESGKIQFKGADGKPTTLKWSDFVRRTVPSDVILKINFFPSFRITTGVNWNETIEEAKEFIFYTTTEFPKRGRHGDLSYSSLGNNREAHIENLFKMLKVVKEAYCDNERSIEPASTPPTQAELDEEEKKKAPPFKLDILDFCSYDSVTVF